MLNMCKLTSHLSCQQEKTRLLEHAEKEKKKRAEQMQQANADLARQAGMIRDLQAQSKGKNESKDGGHSLDQASTWHKPFWN